MEEKNLHVRIVPMTADHLDEVAELSVPLLAEAHTGHNWLAAKG